MRLDVFTSQRTFRALLEALARPGRVEELPAPAGPGPVPPVLTVPLALADVTQTLAVVGPEAPRWARLVAGATGCGSAPPDRADQVVVVGPADPALIPTLPVGDPMSPEDGCRLALAVTDLRPVGEESGGRRAGGDDRMDRGRVRLRLTGPGVDGVTAVDVGGVDPAVFEALGRANAGFPAGIDTFLVDGDGRVVGLPRSAVIEIEGGS